MGTAGDRTPGGPGLPRSTGGLPQSRRWWGLGLVLVGLPVLTAALAGLRDVVTLETVLLVYLLAVVVIAVVGGLVPALLAAVVSFLLANWFLTPPYYTLVVESRDSVTALAVFVAVAVLVSLTVHLAARRQAAADRSRAESDLLATFSREPVTGTSLNDALDQIRATFGMDTVALVDTAGQPGGGAGEWVASVGTPPTGQPVIEVRANDRLTLIAYGPQPFAEDRRVLRVLAATAARTWEAQQLGVQAADAERLAAVDQARSALLAAVGHDLRTPLAGIKAAVTSLRQDDVDWSPDERSDLLETIETSTDRLDDLISNLLAMSRLQAGALSVHLAPVAVDEVVARALLSRPGNAEITVDVGEELPWVLADGGLLERVIANLVVNACRYAPAGRPVRVRAERRSDVVTLCVIDNGPGVADADRDDIFTPFRRLDDSSSGTIGLGLAIARGFTEAMGGTLMPSTTPGGGLTMSVTLPTVP